MLCHVDLAGAEVKFAFNFLHTPFLKHIAVKYLELLGADLLFHPIQRDWMDVVQPFLFPDFFQLEAFGVGKGFIQTGGFILGSLVGVFFRSTAGKPSGELTKEDYEKVTAMNLKNQQLTSVKELEKCTQLEYLLLGSNKLTSVKGLEKLVNLNRLQLDSNQLIDLKGLEKLTKLEVLWLRNNHNLTKAQIDELQKALPKCQIEHTATK